jgi:uncharacterized tellurite resistance protein B-like protein
MDVQDRIRVCKVVAQAILADAQVTDRERKFLENLMDRYELDKAQRKEVRARNLGDDAGDLAKGITDPAVKKELLVELVRAVATDGEVADTERNVVNRVASVLGYAEKDLDPILEEALG